MNYRLCLLLGIACLLGKPLMAQSLIAEAERQFNQSYYDNAAALYEQVLAKPDQLSEKNRLSAKRNLGYSYQQLHNSKKAEQVFRELLHSESILPEDAECYLRYAQALASNGKYKEAEVAFDKYGRLKQQEKQGNVANSRYGNTAEMLQKAGTYKLDFLPMNTPNAEFSPMVYQKGLVFVSTGGKNRLKKAFAKNTPFLDLFYLPTDEQTAKGKLKQLPLGKDSYTSPTANDSKMQGVYAGTQLHLGYEEQPTSRSERFYESLNTKYHEGPATFTKDGSRIIFTRNNYNEGRYKQSTDRVNKLKLYTATQVNGRWSKAEELAFNGDQYSTGHPALSADDQLLYFASDRPGGFGGTDIYVSRWTNGKWGTPINLGKEINTKGNELFPFVDENGGLYFSSNGLKGVGGLDLFYAQLSGGDQVKSVNNLGKPFNSSKDDFGIVTDAARQSGYLSSNRRNGGADDDIYRFTRESSLYPCRELTLSVFDADSNTPLDNTFVAINAANGQDVKQMKTNNDGLLRFCLDAESDATFLASREGYLTNKIGFSTKNLSDDQPYRIDISLAKPQLRSSEVFGPSTTTLRGRVTTQATKTGVVGAKIRLTNLCDGIVQETTTDANGQYELMVLPGCDYQLESTKEGMAAMSSLITSKGVGSPDLVMFTKGDVVKINNIYYSKDKATITPAAAAELDKVATLLKQYPAMMIELRSHTDSRAVAQHNKTLSTNRAKSAVAYLRLKGISPTRIIAKGYGESELLNKCKDGVTCTEEEHEQNRRTEIKILSLN
ncbi:OmpA family protein [Spirosoma pomorum]